MNDQEMMLIRKKSLKIQERLGMRVGIAFGTHKKPIAKTTQDVISTLSELYKIGLKAFVLPKELFINIKDSQDIYKEHYNELLKIRNLAQKYNIELSVYNDSLPEDPIKLDNTLKTFISVAGIMDCRAFITQPNFYRMVPKDQAIKLVIYKINEIANSLNIKTKIGIETTGLLKEVGSLEDIIEISKRTTNTEPVLNFGNIHARGVGALRDENDFKRVLEKTKKEMGPNWSQNAYVFFSGVTYGPSGLKSYIPFSRSDLKLSYLIKSFMTYGVKGTIIFNDPIREDAILNILKEFGDMVR